MLTILVRLILDRKFKARVQELLFCECHRDATIELFIVRANDIVEQVATQYGNELNHLLGTPTEEVQQFIIENIHYANLSIGHLL